MAASRSGSSRSSHSIRSEIEVVRRLVEQQHVGLRAKRARQRGARELPSRERRERSREIILRESETPQVGPRALAPAVPASRFELLLSARVAREQLRTMVVAHLLLELLQPRLELE